MNDNVFTISLTIIALALIVSATVLGTGCSQRAQQFKLACINNAGTYISSGSLDHCVTPDGKKTVAP